MTTILMILALIVLVPVAGCVLLGLIGSVVDHTQTPNPSGGWGLGLAFAGYILGALFLLGLFVPR